jgi:Putative rhamnosyl transferase
MTGMDAARPRGIEHFLLTNFNVRLGWTRDVHGRTTLTPEWMEHRWRLFETFCLPSVRCQTDPRFRWLVRFDPGTPEGHRRRFRELTAGMTNVTPLWRAEPFGAAVGALLDPSADVLLTTRLDNDDAIHRTAMARIRAAVGDARPEFLNFPEGFALLLTEGPSRMVRYTHHSNPFLSLVERVEITARARRACRELPVGPLRILASADRWLRLGRSAGLFPAGLRRGTRRLIGQLPATVRCVDHRRAAEFAPVRQASTDAMWLRVIHGRNAGRLGPSEDACSDTSPVDGVAAAFGIRLPIDPDLGRAPMT